MSNSVCFGAEIDLRSWFYVQSGVYFDENTLKEMFYFEEAVHLSRMTVIIGVGLLVTPGKWRIQLSARLPTVLTETALLFWLKYKLQLEVI